MTRRRMLLGALAAGVLAACGRREAAQRFPSLALRGLDGGVLALDALRERPLLINFWATWCPPCRREMASLERTSRRAGTALRVIGISLDEDLNLAREFVRKSALTFLNLADPGGRATRPALALSALPETFLVSRDGSIRARMRGAREWDDEALLAALLRAAAGAT